MALSHAKAKSARGRKAGQLGKAHDSVSTVWEHLSLATHGNFTREVQDVAFRLGKLARVYKQVLGEKRWNLECNRRGIKIPLPILPAGDKFSESEFKLLRSSGMDVIWIMEYQGYLEAFRALASLVRAAANGDTVFFKELARRVGSGVPLESPAEPVYSALAGLKDLYESPNRYNDAYRVPSLISVFNYPPGKRPPLTITQISEYVRVFANVKESDRSLSRKARQIGLVIAPRGRPKNRH